MLYCRENFQTNLTLIWWSLFLHKNKSWGNKKAESLLIEQNLYFLGEKSFWSKFGSNLSESGFSQYNTYLSKNSKLLFNTVVIIWNTQFIIINTKSLSDFSKFCFNLWGDWIQISMPWNNIASIVIYNRVRSTPKNKSPVRIWHRNKFPIFNLRNKWGFAFKISSPFKLGFQGFLNLGKSRCLLGKIWKGYRLTLL